MKGSKSFQKYIFILFLIGCICPVTIKAGAKIGIEVLDKDGIISIGEPLNVHLSVEFEQPVVAGSLNPFHGIYCEINNVNSDTDSVTILKIPSSFMVEDRQGLKYGQNFTILYDHFRRRLVFDQHGEYNIKFSFTRNVSSQTKISVEKGLPLDEKAISLLSDPNDYFFLEFGEHEYPEKKPERISHLKHVVEQCEGTLIAKWASARLGIEEAKELEEKYPDGENFLAQYRQGKIKEPLVDQAQSHLSKAYHLPDEFPIRSEVLTRLSRTEYVGGDYKKAISLLEELATKYPESEDGRKALRWKEELQQLREREKGATPPALWTQSSFLICAAFGMGIVVIGIVFLLKKKTRSRGK